MPLDAGQLRHRIEFQELVRYIDSTGETVEEWCFRAYAWAAVEPVSGREFIASQAVQSAVSARITVRYRTDLKPNMRLIHRGCIYVIEAILPDKDSGLEYLTLMCSQGVSDS